MTILGVDTPHGQACVHLHPVDAPRGALVLGHGAAGGVDAPDLVAVTDVARAEGLSRSAPPTRSAARIGVALQEAAIDPLMTGRELLRMQGALHGLRGAPARERAGSLLDRVGLSEAGDRRVGGYSGGMRRRLDLALALVHAPVVLFRDEPTTGLDPTSRAALWREVRSLNDEGTTVFLTTQYLEEAEQLADRVGIIAGGRLVAEGTPTDLKAHVGEPTLHIELTDPDAAPRARKALAGLGVLEPPRPEAPTRLALRSSAGKGAIAPAVGIAGIASAIALRTGSLSLLPSIFPFIFVLLFTAPAFFPQELLAPVLRDASVYNPLTYIVEGVRALLAGDPALGNVWAGLAAAAALAVATTLLATFALKERLRTA